MFYWIKIILNVGYKFFLFWPQIWPVISSAWTKYQADGHIMERCCRFLRFSIRCVGIHAANLLEPLVKQVIFIIESCKPKLSLFNYRIWTKFILIPVLISYFTFLFRWLLSTAFTSTAVSCILEVYLWTNCLLLNVYQFYWKCFRLLLNRRLPFCNSPMVLETIRILWMTFLD